MAISVNYKSTPLTYADLAAPFEQIKEVYDQTQEAYDKVDQTVSTLESQIREGDTRAMQQYKAYMARFDPAIESFSHGMNVVNMSALTGLRHDMYKEIQPIANAALRRATLEDEQRKALSTNPELIYERRASDMSLDTFMDDPLADYGRTINGEAVYNRARDAFDHISKAFGDAKINYEEAPNGALMAEVTKETGLNAEQLNNLYKAYESGNLSTSDLAQLVVAQTAQNLFNQTGVQNWGNPSAELQVRNKIISALEYTLGTRDVTVQNLGGGSGGGSGGGKSKYDEDFSRTNWSGNPYSLYTQNSKEIQNITIYDKESKKWDLEKMKRGRVAHALDVINSDTSTKEEKNAQLKYITKQNVSLDRNSNGRRQHVGAYVQYIYGKDDLRAYQEMLSLGIDPTKIDDEEYIKLLYKPERMLVGTDALTNVGFRYKVKSTDAKEIVKQFFAENAHPEYAVLAMDDAGELKMVYKKFDPDDYGEDYKDLDLGSVVIFNGGTYLKAKKKGEDEQMYIPLSAGFNDSAIATVNRISKMLPALNEEMVKIEQGQQPSKEIKEFLEQTDAGKQILQRWDKITPADRIYEMNTLIEEMYKLVGRALQNNVSKNREYDGSSIYGG